MLKQVQHDNFHMNLSVVIPVYKNKEQFLRNLRHNLQFLKNAEVIVVNDYPDESLQDDMKSFKEVKLIENKKNLGFAGAVNTGVFAATKDYVMLLNTDVMLLDDSYQKVLAQFKEDSQLFGVSFAQKEKDGTIVGNNRFFWRQGLFYHRKAADLQAGINGWAEGGSCILDRKKFVSLNGFDEIYKPFYWEDIDLSYRAWKTGYHVLFNPDVIVEHHHESTIGRYFMSDYVKKIAFRNQFIFVWENITDKRLCLEYLLWHPYNKAFYLFKGEWNFFKGMLSAVPFIPTILRRRAQTKFKISDAEVLQKFK